MTGISIAQISLFTGFGCCFVVQSLSSVGLFATPCTSAQPASMSFTVSQSLLRFMSLELVMLSNHLIFYGPFLLLPSIFPGISVFPSDSALRIRLPTYWSYSSSNYPSNEYSGSISFRMDWFDLLAVQGTLKSLLQHHSLKTSVLRHSALFIVHLLHLYMTTGKTITLTMWSFVGIVISLLLKYTVLGLS